MGKNIKNTKKGFTLVEIILAVAILSIISAITLTILNPAERLAQARNLERRAAVAQVANAVKQYASVSGQQLGDLGTIANCPSTSVVGSSGVDLASSLVDEYLPRLPIDPTIGSAADSGYVICQTGSGRIQVDAPGAELGQIIDIVV